MADVIADKQDELRRLCDRYHVRRLELFGSAAGQGYDPTHSDLDFLVEFEQMEPGLYADCYFGLLEDLEALFGRPVDLVMLSAVENPYFLAEIEASRRVLYAAA